MPGMDGIEATRRIVGEGRRSRVLILTTFDLDEYAFAGLRAGASGFLLKDVPPADLLVGHPRGRRAATRVVVAERDPPAARHVRHRLPAPDARRAADARARRAHRARAGGARPRSREDARTPRSPSALVLSEATVKTHVGRILAKLGLRDRVQAVVFAYDVGLAQPTPP